MKSVLVMFMFTGALLAQAPQAPNPTQQAATNQAGGPTPVYRVTVVSRTTKAVNYRHHSGSTKVDLRGTTLMPDARGDAKVESKPGVIKIDADMEKMQRPTAYGPEYLTYVMWAITPEGRATNLGEVLLNSDKSKLSATTELQAFGLIVTAEPYFAVTQPSDVVVMENFIRQDTVGGIEEVDAKFELLQRGQYTLNVSPKELKPLPLDPKIPLELYEARNAVRIAGWAGADRYAPDAYEKARHGLENAEGYLQRKAGAKPIATAAREAAQMAEDARIIAIKRIEDERIASDKAAAAEREARAKAEAEAQTREAEMQSQRRAQAEADRAAAERMKAEAVRARQEAEQAAEFAAKQKAEADQARAAALAQQQMAQTEAEKARLAADEADRLRMKAETEKEQLRAQLLQQLNLILETRDTARGLVVSMSDVLFDTGKYSLKPGAREKLAKVSGIVLSHPGLKLAVEGHTDSVGSEDMNQRLSENRAMGVRDFLVQQGLSINDVTAQGFGKTMPVATNDTAEGRQRNRRVELIVSGEVIGTKFGNAL